MNELEVRDEGDLRHYRTEIPNLVLTLGLSPQALALYVHLKRTAGPDGECRKKTTTLATETGISVAGIPAAKAELRQARPELGGQALIVIREEKNRGGGRPKHVIRCTDIWPENMQHFSQIAKNVRRASSPIELASSPIELGKEPIEEITTREPSSPIELALVSEKQSSSLSSACTNNPEVAVAARLLYGRKSPSARASMSAEQRRICATLAQELVSAGALPQEEGEAFWNGWRASWRSNWNFKTRVVDEKVFQFPTRQQVLDLWFELVEVGRAGSPAATAAPAEAEAARMASLQAKYNLPRTEAR